MRSPNEMLAGRRSPEDSTETVQPTSTAAGVSLIGLLMLTPSYWEVSR
jgi:hypothetical protein